MGRMKVPAETPAPEALVEMPFPGRGLDLRGSFEDDSPDTTEVGTNVRVFEAATGRGRGGSRSGLTPYVPDPVNGAHPIQCLDLVTSFDVTRTGIVMYNAQTEVAHPFGKITLLVNGTGQKIADVTFTTAADQDAYGAHSYGCFDDESPPNAYVAFEVFQLAPPATLGFYLARIETSGTTLVGDLGAEVAYEAPVRLAVGPIRPIWCGFYGGVVYALTYTVNGATVRLWRLDPATGASLDGPSASWKDSGHGLAYPMSFIVGAPQQSVCLAAGSIIILGYDVFVDPEVDPFNIILQRVNLATGAMTTLRTFRAGVGYSDVPNSVQSDGSGRVVTSWLFIDRGPGGNYTVHVDSTTVDGTAGPRTAFGPYHLTGQLNTLTFSKNYRLAVDPGGGQVLWAWSEFTPFSTDPTTGIATGYFLPTNVLRLQLRRPNGEDLPASMTLTLTYLSNVQLPPVPEARPDGMGGFVVRVSQTDQLTDEDFSVLFRLSVAAKRSVRLSASAAGYAIYFEGTGFAVEWFAGEGPRDLPSFWLADSGPYSE